MNSATNEKNEIKNFNKQIEDCLKYPHRIAAHREADVIIEHIIDAKKFGLDNISLLSKFLPYIGNAIIDRNEYNNDYPYKYPESTNEPDIYPYYPEYYRRFENYIFVDGRYHVDGRYVYWDDTRSFEFDNELINNLVNIISSYPDIINPIMNFLDVHYQNEVILAASSILGEIRDIQAVEPLLKKLNNDESSVVRAAAASALGQIGDKQAVEPLINTLINDESENTRAAAVSALCKIDGKQAVKPLINTLINDESSAVRAAAASSLGQIGDKQAVEPLITTYANDNKWNVQEAALKAIEFMGASAVDILISILINDKSEKLRVAAASSLGQIGDKQAVEPLINTLTNDENENTRAAAVSALCKIDGKQAVKPLINTLVNDKNENTRATAALALGKIGDKQAIEPLIKTFINDLSPHVWDASSKSIECMGADVVEPLIIIIVNNKNRPEEKFARRFLTKTGDKAYGPLINIVIYNNIPMKVVAAKELAKIIF